MSHVLWKAWIDEDVERFRRLLAPAGYSAQSASRSPHIGTGGAGSPGAFGTSPRNVAKMRKSSGFGQGSGNARSGGTNFGRAEVNSRDHAGLTILLRAASSTSENAIAFVEALLDHPAIDIYVQDPESGWNALHRALYAGNISIARLLLDNERRVLTGQTVGASLTKVGRLIKTKDNEGHSPFDLYNSTIGKRDLKNRDEGGVSEDDSEGEDIAIAQDTASSRGLLDLVEADEVFAFGSNKNLSLGLGDEDDRQFPERVYLKRPNHLVQRFYDEFLESAAADLSGSTSCTLGDIPTLTSFRPLYIQDVVLSKFHSAILTTDPVSNLYVCGIGRGGRLGLSDENTRFNYTPVQGGLTNKKVIQVALGQNHTMAITDSGELWTFGSNTHSQLGYSVPEPINKGEEPMVTQPRQVFGPLKKETIIGIAASTIHSVAHTGTSLYCWGRNVGQLALMDADSRSLEVQQTPRKVAVSLFTSPIVMVSAIDKATICLLASHTVIVFTSYGYNIVKFSFSETFSNYHLGKISMSSRYDAERNQIKYIGSGGETIAAVTGRGDLFTMALTQNTDAHTSTSTTNPSKIKGAVSHPVCIWNAHKDGVRSVGVGEHGSVIISTQSGAVWRRVKRTKAKDSYATGPAEAKRKDFKFQRVPGITNIVTVRSSVSGAFAAVRKDSEVMREQVIIDPQTLWDDIAPLNCLRDFKSSEPSTKQKDKLKFWDTDRPQAQLGSVAYEVLKSPDLDTDLQNYLLALRYGNDDLDAVICTSSAPELRIPVHSWILSARSATLRRALSAIRGSGTCESSDYLAIDQIDGKTVLTFLSLDIISILNLVLYMYEDRVIPAWNYTRHDPSLAYRYRQVRAEVVKLASKLEMSKLEAAAQKQTNPQRSLDRDMRSAIQDPDFFDDGDAIIELDGDELPAHSELLCQRCPFFEALFHGRSQGMWLASRRTAHGPSGRIPIDLKHVKPKTFKYVLIYLYADVGDDLFDDVADSLDAFSDLVMDVLSISNELMLDRLSQICQQVIARFIDTRNIAYFLNAISPCSVTEFKDAGLEYICLQVEYMLENHLLDDLEYQLLESLDEVVRDNQRARYPFSKSGRAELLLHERHPELAQDIDEERQRRVREMAFKAAQKDEERKFSSSLKGKFGSLEDLTPMSPALEKRANKARAGRNEPFSPNIYPKAAQTDLIFNMDEDDGPLDSPSIRPQRASDLKRQPELDQIPSLTGSSHDEKEMKAAQREAIQRPGSQSPWVTPPPGAVSPSYGQVGSTAATVAGKCGNPWAATNLPTAKLDLREIMGEASPNRSALSAGLAAQKASDASGKPQQTKLSQKERKKQQQLHAAQAVQAASMPPVKTAWERSSTEAKPSPWKTVSSAPKPSLKGDLTEAPKTAPPNAKALLAAETPSKSIPRRTQSPDTRHSGQSRTPTTATPPARPYPQPTSSTSTLSGDNLSKPLVPHSKSYIKPAPKAEPTLGLSMTDIIDQERRDRERIKEAVARRSLMEIQQEQEFQEWWDEESRRTQEDEARRLARERGRDNEKSGRARRGRGGKLRSDRGVGNSSIDAASAANEGEAARQQNKGQGRGGRGNRRGRGRGNVARAPS